MTATLDIIITANSGPDYTIKVPYKPYDSLSILLKRIHARLGTDEKSIYHQELFLNDSPLEDHNQTVESYSISDGTTLTYGAVSLPSEYEDDISLHVNVLRGETYTLHFSPDTAIEDIKALLSLLTDHPPSAQTLIFEGKKLEDGCRLSDYSIVDGSIVHLVRRLCSGSVAAAPPGIVFADVSDTSGFRKVHFSEYATPGTNIECECKCTLTRRVICKESFGTLELSQATFACPVCGELEGITPVTVGFMRCKYRFKGTKSSGEEYTSEWKEVATDDYYQLFDSGKEISWLSLNIETVSVEEFDDCVICLEPLREFKVLGCGHHFHKPCIEQWRGLPCPICRHSNGGLQRDTDSDEENDEESDEDSEDSDEESDAEAHEGTDGGQPVQG